jgi:hypothetical protein
LLGGYFWSLHPHRQRRHAADLGEVRQTFVARNHIVRVGSLVVLGHILIDGFRRVRIPVSQGMRFDRLVAENQLRL